MGELVRDGGAELGGYWTYAGRGLRSNILGANTGDWYHQMDSLRSAIPPSSQISQMTQAVLQGPLVVGSTYTIRIAHSFIGINDADLKLRIDPGDGTIADHDTLSAAAQTPGQGWRLWTPASFVAVGQVGQIELRTTHLAASGRCIWLVDDVSIQGDMVAVWLAERAVAEAKALLQANLATELTAIDADRSDSLVITAPANADYHDWARPVVGGARAQIDIWEDSIDFEGGDHGPGHPYTDSQSQRATWKIPIRIRVTFFNENGEDGDTMVARRRRYEAGIFNVFNKNANGSGTYAEVQAVGVTGVLSGTSIGGELPSETEGGIEKWYTIVAAVVEGEEAQ